MRFAYEGTAIVAEEGATCLKEHMPQVNAVFVRKSGVYTQDDPELFEELRQKADAVILGTGH